ncbi:hypothetical protein M9M90_13635 [Phenylobacterium sp. LH3H17]|uniref:hypothetical protein n=1 Tax=Phenylobacterium sp. LH3H17 TaxID=2903901 RepID=UPI0020C94E0D|nr:hypothetical protein [Phenylobacterium sp. LH3H17]UTP38255.1 hypothetical protein M9M90_13635 [Phenylobacterium sp. LH3H17]
MAAACLTGLTYFALVFSLAFATGAARVLVVAPRLGPTAAVLLEVPLIILASWAIARRLLRDRDFTRAQRLAVGATAFTLTMAAEAGLARIMQGQSLGDWAMTVATPIGLVGLAGQTAFAAMPLLVGHDPRGPRAEGDRGPVPG